MREEKSKSGKVKMRNKALFIGIVAIALAVAAIGATANNNTEVSDEVNVPDVPHKINYQGYLTDAAGNQITGDRDMTFKIYDSPTGGTPLWSETQNSVHVEKGLFNVILGSDNPIPSDVFPSDGSRWLETEIEGLTLTHRKEIVSGGYAFKADKADFAVATNPDDDWVIVPPNIYTGITAPITGNVGIGTTEPHSKLEICTDDYIGLSLDGNTIKSINACPGTQPIPINVDLNLKSEGPWGSILLEPGPEGGVFAGRRIYLRSNPNTLSRNGNFNPRLFYEGMITGNANVLNNPLGWGLHLNALPWTWGQDAIYYHGGTHRFYTVSGGGSESEKIRITSDGNVGIGTTTPDAKLEVVGNILQDKHGDDPWAANHVIRKARGSMSAPFGVMKDDDVAWISGQGYDGNVYLSAAGILMEVDGDPGPNDMPGRIVFQTTKDGTNQLKGRMVIKNDGCVGIGTASPEAKLDVFTDDQMRAILGGAVGGSSNEACGVYGIAGDRSSLTQNSRLCGVQGRAANWWSSAPGDFYGGYFDIFHNPIYVPSPGANYFGVYASARGDLNCPQTCYGIYAEAKDGANNYAGYFNGNFLVVNGFKMAAVKIDEEYRMLSGLESPEVLFEDFGSGRLVNGRARIDLDPLFLKAVTVNADNPIKVFVQLNGECNGVYVEKGTDGFDVIELDKGTNNVPFDYRVVAKRKGYENYRFEKMGGLTPEEMEAKQAVYSEKTEKELKDLLQYQGKEIDEVK